MAFNFLDQAREFLDFKDDKKDDGGLLNSAQQIAMQLLQTDDQEGMERALNGAMGELVQGAIAGHMQEEKRPDRENDPRFNSKIVSKRRQQAFLGISGGGNVNKMPGKPKAKGPAVKDKKPTTPEVVNKPAPEVVNKPAPEVVNKPAPEVVNKPAPIAPVNAPVTPEVVNKPAPEAVNKPAPEVVNKPAPEVVNKPAPEVVNKPAPEVVNKPAPEAVNKPAPEVVNKPAPEAVNKPAPEVVNKPAPEAVNKPAPEVVNKPAPEVVNKPAPVVNAPVTPEVVNKPADPVNAPVNSPTEVVNKPADPVNAPVNSPTDVNQAANVNKPKTEGKENKQAKDELKGLEFPAEATAFINTASFALLQEVKYIGPSRAQAVIDYRNKISGFESFDEFIDVEGIGPKIVEYTLEYLDNKDYVPETKEDVNKPEVEQTEFANKVEKGSKEGKKPVNQVTPVNSPTDVNQAVEVNKPTNVNQAEQKVAADEKVAAKGYMTKRPPGVDPLAWKQWLERQAIMEIIEEERKKEKEEAITKMPDQPISAEPEEETSAYDYDPLQKPEEEVVINPNERPDPKVLASFIGKSNVEEMNNLNDKGSWYMKSGIWYSHGFDRYHKKSTGKPMPQHYWKGYTNEKYFENKGFYSFELRKGQSASKAIEAFFTGLTVAECYSAIMAIEYRSLLKTFGAEKFDELFGSEGKETTNRMLIEARPSANNPLQKLSGSTDAAKTNNSGEFGDRPAKDGEWYYFYNHPKYLLKHPAGAFQGENSLYMGKNKKDEQIWRGFGVDEVTEQDMLNEMAHAYNNPRTDYDKDRIKKMADQGQDVSIFDEENFPGDIGWQDVLSADAFQYGGTTRKGGFMARAGQKVNEELIADLMAAMGIDIGGKKKDKNKDEE